MKKILWVLVLIPVLAAAKDRHAPLPDVLIAARTIYIENQSSHPDVTDKAYAELQKWGRFTVVSSRSKADLILLFSTKVYQTGSTTTGTVDDSSYANVRMNTTTDTTGYTFMTVVDAKTGDSLWSESKRWGAFRSATKGIIKDLRERMEEQQ